MKRNEVQLDKFNPNAIYPYQLRLQDFQMAMQDVYDFFSDVNEHLRGKRPGYQARVADDDDVEVAPGEPGELLLRADEPFAFATGYFGMAGKTVEAWRNLWFHTGDRVVRDADGHFRFLDRLKDAIRRRGENISSYEVEQVLLSHPVIEVAAVFPVRSELAEDEVMAALVARPGCRIDVPGVAKFCETRLPYFAIPR